MAALELSFGALMLTCGDGRIITKATLVLVI
jgi:hypothetical protein